VGKLPDQITSCAKYREETKDKAEIALFCEFRARRVGQMAQRR
jgi:hypothetical protein